MAEFVLSAILPVLFEKLASPEFLNSAFEAGVISKLKKWERKLEKIKAVLKSAEEKQLTNEAVKLWLEDLQHLAYDVEDILEEFAYEASRHNSVNIPSCFKNFTPRTIKFDVSMRSRVKDIDGRFEELYKERSELGLMHEASGGTSNTAASAQQGSDPRPPTSSLQTEVAVGRDEDKKKILDKVSSDKPSDANFGVIAIVGMGGLGKTTLAQEVFNDKELEHLKFEKKAWVSISHDFDVMRILKSILESISHSSTNLNSLNRVQDKLKEEILGRKLLLVLDDVWNESYSLWETLQSPFKDSARGSKIIVTTRSKNVASTMRSYETHELKGLSNDACWNLFLKHAHPTSVDIEKFRERVVKKCAGLPLAAKTLGGVLRNEERIQAWENILDSRLWDSFEGNDILPVLRLSYHHLPSHLKRCFAYCALFPKDYEFDEEELGLLWLGEGIVQQSDKHLDLTGEYFRHLCSRSFFQPSSGNNSKYVMHDLIHDLAQSVLGEIGFRFEEANSMLPKKIERTRHFSYISKYYDGENIFKDLQQMKSLRTFMPIIMNPCYGDHHYIVAILLFDLLPHFKKLRVLSLESYYIPYLPNSIGGLIYLRYLNFSYTPIKSLPESISSLFNLQILLLKGCSRLIELPPKIIYLINLYHLDIKYSNSLRGMPSGMKELKNLRRLSNFIVVKGIDSNLNDLKNLNFLQGELHISNLENVAHQNQIRQPILKNKKDLEVLLLEWGSQSEGSQKEEVESHVFNMLQPHSSLKELIIKCYGGSCFPSWLGDASSLSNVTVLKLENCKNCRSLPSLGLLNSLKDLTIEGMESLQIIDFEMPFESLEILRFENLQEWKCWNIERQNDDVEKFPLLRELFIVKCPKVTGQLPCHLPSLEILSIKKCAELTVFVSSFSVLCKLDIDDCKEVVCSSSSTSTNFQPGNWINQGFQIFLKIISSWRESTYFGKPLHNIHGLKSLKDLSVVNCRSLVLFPEINFVPNLSSMEISNLEALKSLQEGLKEIILERLVIEDCDSRTFFEGSMIPLSVRKLEIRHCKKLEYMENFRFTHLEYLEIEYCESLTCISSNGWLLDKLKQLYIRYCSKLESIREIFEYTTCLQSIKFWNCKSLKSVPSDLQNLTSLQSIVLVDCPSMEISFKFPNSLKELNIQKCPILFAEEGLPTNLTKLTVWKGAKIIRPLIEWGLHNLTSLRDLRITCEDSSLTSLALQSLTSLTSLKRLSIGNFPETIVYLGNLTSLESLFISQCPKLKSIPDLESLTSLQSLRITECPELKSIPDLESLTSLESLSISQCPELKSIPDLESLTSLNSLSISTCPKLKSLQSLPSSLMDVRIKDCPLLKRHWKRCTGKYCSRIAHIPKVQIDNKCIFNSKESE